MEGKQKPTVALVEELAQREGVKKITVEPYCDETITVSGPAVILVIED